MRYKNLEALKRAMSTCTGCELHKHRNLVVLPDGPVTAKYLVVSDRPGTVEDQCGIPMTGDAGRLLNNMLTVLELPREDVMVTNAVCCLPPDKDATPLDAITTCHDWLAQLIYMVDPFMVFAMGTTAVKSLVRAGGAVTQLLGRIALADIPGIMVPYQVPVVVLTNPAYILRDGDTGLDSLRHRQVYEMQKALVLADQLIEICHGIPAPSRGAQVPVPRLYGRIPRIKPDHGEPPQQKPSADPWDDTDDART